MKNNILNNKLKWSLTLLFLLFLTLPFACETILNEATITGKVVNGETTQPVEGAFIRAIGFSESVETDSAGAYELLLSIEDPEIDDVTLEISKSGFLTDTLQNIGLKLGGTVNAPPSNLIPIATTSGQVIISGVARNAVPIVEGELGAPIDSAFVRVFDINDPNAIAYSDSLGRYLLKFNVDADDSNSITIQISKSTFLPDTISNIGISFTDTIIVRDANLFPISTASGEATIFGKVINSSSGSPIEAVTIRALNRTEKAQTDSSGEYYLLLDIKPGESNTVTLEASKEGFNSALINNLGIAIGDTVSAPPVALLALSITEGIASLSGNVINGQTKAPIEGAHVRALDHSEIALSDSNGNYLLSIALAEGESNVVNIEIGSSGFLTSTIPNVGLAIGDTIAMATANLIAIDPGGAIASITGRIFDDIFNRALEGAVVKVLGHPESAVSDAGGNFELNVVIEKDDSTTVDIEFAHESFVADTLRDIRLTVGGTFELPSLMRLVPFSTETTLSGRVIDAVSGIPIDNAIVRSLGRGETTTTDFRGEYELTMTVRHDESNIISFDYFKIGYVPDSLLNISLARGGKTAAAEISLLPTQTTSIITGRVIDDLNSESLSGALVRAIGGHTESTTTDSRGEYSLSVILSNEEDNIISIEISNDNFVSDTLADLLIVRGGTFDAGLTTLNIIFADAIVTGNVIDDLTGAPISDAIVRVFGFPETATTDFRGEFSLAISISNAASSSIVGGKSLNKFGKTLQRSESTRSNKAPKSIKRQSIQREKRSFSTISFSAVSEVVTLEISKDNFIPDTLSNITISKGTTFNTGQRVLTTIAALSTISGEIKDAVSGQPVNGAIVTALGYIEATISNSIGEYDLSFLVIVGANDTTDLKITKTGYLPDTLTGIVIQRGGSATAPLSSLTPITTQTTITGNVNDAILSEALEGASVRILGHDETATSNFQGDYELTISLAHDEATSVQVVATLADFIPDTLTAVALVRGGSVAAPQASLFPVVRAGLPANATIFSVTRTSISIQGAGGDDETTELTYQLEDASGVPLDKYRPIEVTFSLSGPGGGEFLDPVADTTDENGLVTTTLNSGTIAGVVQVRATFDPGTGAITSLPTPIAIHGGHPDSAHFTITSTRNIAGLVSIREAIVTVIIGDKFSNFVRPGTAVSFRSKYGLIEGSAVTDASGRASVTLISSNPLPLTSDSGFVPITAETKDENGNSIFAIDTMLWSGHTALDMVGFGGSFTIADGGGETFTVWVRDIEHQRPLEGGTTIDFSASLGSVSGSTIVPDTQDRGPGTTLFSFTISDADIGDVNPPAPSIITILVTSPNGNAQIQISGTID